MPVVVEDAGVPCRWIWGQVLVLGVKLDVWEVHNPAGVPKRRLPSLGLWINEFVFHSRFDFACGVLDTTVIIISPKIISALVYYRTMFAAVACFFSIP